MGSPREPGAERDIGQQGRGKFRQDSGKRHSLDEQRILWCFAEPRGLERTKGSGGRRRLQEIRDGFRVGVGFAVKRKKTVGFFGGHLVKAVVPEQRSHQTQTGEQGADTHALRVHEALKGGWVTGHLIIENKKEEAAYAQEEGDLSDGFP